MVHSRARAERLLAGEIDKIDLETAGLQEYLGLANKLCAKMNVYRTQKSQQYINKKRILSCETEEEANLLYAKIMKENW